eukprot:scaffold116857_cov57-Phaeocystis_antarctica.AAC.1
MQCFARGWLTRQRGKMASAATIVQRRFRKDALFRRSHAGRASKKKRRRTVTALAPGSQQPTLPRPPTPRQKPHRLRTAALLPREERPRRLAAEEEATVARQCLPTVADSAASDHPCRAVSLSLPQAA